MYARRLTDLNERILSLYARDMSVLDKLPPGRPVRRGVLMFEDGLSVR
jgi:hypothetical protein